jgi:hypothetical protein
LPLWPPRRRRLPRSHFWTPHDPPILSTRQRLTSPPPALNSAVRSCALSRRKPLSTRSDHHAKPRPRHRYSPQKRWCFRRTRSITRPNTLDPIEFPRRNSEVAAQFNESYPQRAQTQFAANSPALRIGSSSFAIAIFDGGQGRSAAACDLTPVLVPPLMLVQEPYQTSGFPSRAC